MNELNKSSKSKSSFYKQKLIEQSPSHEETKLMCYSYAKSFIEEIKALTKDF